MHSLLPCEAHGLLYTVSQTTSSFSIGSANITNKATLLIGGRISQYGLHTYFQTSGQLPRLAMAKCIPTVQGHFEGCFKLRQSQSQIKSGIIISHIKSGAFPHIFRTSRFHCARPKSAFVDLASRSHRRNSPTPSSL